MTNQGFVSLNNNGPLVLCLPLKQPQPGWASLAGDSLTLHTNGASWAASVEASQCPNPLPTAPSRPVYPPFLPRTPERKSPFHLLNDINSTFEFLPRTSLTSSSRDATRSGPPPFANHQWNSASKSSLRAALPPLQIPPPRCVAYDVSDGQWASDPAFRSGLRGARRWSDDANFRRLLGSGDGKRGRTQSLTVDLGTCTE